MITDYLKFSLRSLKERKVRSGLTVLGIFLAIVTIFVLLSMSLGLSETVDKEFQKLGGDRFFIQPKGQLGAPGTGGAVQLTLDDVDFIEKIKGVGQVSYVVAGSAKVTFKEKSRYVYAMGFPMDKEKLDFILDAGMPDIASGGLIKQGDVKKVVVGSRYSILFDNPVKTGNKILINDVEFEVVGVFEAIGSPTDDSQVYMTLDDFKELYGSGDRVDFIYVSASPGEDLNAVADNVERKLIKHRGVTEKTVDFSILTPEELLASFGTILNILTAFLVGIGFISVLVGGIGIANTMYTSVLERKKEIGTMKAIGARNSDILLIFVIEAGILGLIGGVLGLAVGAGIAKMIEIIANQALGGNLLQASFNPIIVFGSLGFAFLVGILSGVLPSYQASKLKPVDALRYE